MNFVKSLWPLLTAPNIGRIIAIILALCGLPGLVETTPKAMSSAGVPVDDLLGTLAPFIGAIATWFGANWLKATPELVSAAISLVRRPSDQDAAARFEVACLRMLGTRHENSPAVQAAIAQLASVLAEARFPRPSPAASASAATERPRLPPMPYVGEGS